MTLASIANQSYWRNLNHLVQLHRPYVSEKVIQVYTTQKRLPNCEGQLIPLTITKCSLERLPH